MNLEKRIIDEIIDISSKYKNINKVILFGSRARGDNLLKSDIDKIYNEVDKGTLGFINVREELRNLALQSYTNKRMLDIAEKHLSISEKNVIRKDKVIESKNKTIKTLRDRIDSLMDRIDSLETKI